MLARALLRHSSVVRHGAVAATSLPVRCKSSAAGDIYAQKLQHHLLDGDFKAAVKLFEGCKKAPPTLQNVMTLVQRLSGKANALQVQRQTISFFLKRQRQHGPALLTAYTELKVALPSASFRELALALIQANDTTRTLEALEMAIAQGVAIPADVFHQCFLMCQEFDWASQPFTTVFLQACDANLIEPLNYPCLADTILRASFKQRAVDGALACIARLPDPHASSKKLERLRWIFQDMHSLTSSMDTSAKTLVTESLISFCMENDDASAWAVFHALPRRHRTPQMLKDIVLALVRLKQYDQAEHVLLYALKFKPPMAPHVFTIAIRETQSIKLVEHYLAAVRDGRAETSVAALAIAIRAALAHDPPQGQLALDVHAEACARHLDVDHRLATTLHYVGAVATATAADDQGDGPTLLALIFGFVQHHDLALAMPLFRGLVAADIDVLGGTLKNMLHVVDAEADAVMLLQYARDKRIALSTPAVTSALKAVAATSSPVLAGVVLDLVHASLVSPSLNLARRARDAAKGTTAFAAWDEILAQYPMRLRADIKEKESAGTPLTAPRT
ncbi:Aste57867_13252 [Aphanomyces stellatus]|uniref:Aste57867_13252 protein n=1 Tax=Aphanomyces stellatus TaxID=120398 RepID=A0A485KXZ0_9STRA|nr:hypothetical protein As57867_013203 [Aphanomyces stellatus]VFT90092.1 Aste57867_13252 [Aphanomyces stellatus]